jgi:hypothetical protein
MNGMNFIFKLTQFFLSIEVIDNSKKLGRFMGPKFFFFFFFVQPNNALYFA